MASQTFAADYSYFEKIIQKDLASSGVVEVTRVTNQGPRDFVEIDVTSYGETRQSWCVVEEGIVLQCRDNWFDQTLSH
jgi:hypothetical protein